MKVAREDLIQQMEANGFHLVKEHTFLPYQYFLVFQAKPLDRVLSRHLAGRGDGHPRRER